MQAVQEGLCNINIFNLFPPAALKGGGKKESPRGAKPLSKKEA
jgi:hypothetical protein